MKNLLEVEKHLFIYNGGTCSGRGAAESLANIRQRIADEGLNDAVHTTKTFCNGRCNDGPVVIAMPEGKWFKNILPENVNEFVQEYLVYGNSAEKFELFTYGDDIIEVDLVAEKENQS